MKNLQLDIQALNDLYDIYADSRKFGYRGPTRNVRLYRATPSGGGAISKSEDGVRCAVAGKECESLQTTDMELSKPNQLSGSFVSQMEQAPTIRAISRRLAQEDTVLTRLVTFGTGVDSRSIARVRMWRGVMEV